MPKNSGLFVVLILAFALRLSSQGDSSDIFDYSNSLRYARHLIQAEKFEFALQELERIYFMRPESDSLKAELITNYRKAGLYSAGIERARQLFPQSDSITSVFAHEYLRMLLLDKRYSPAENYIIKSKTLGTEDEKFYQLNLLLLQKKWEQADTVFNGSPQVFASYPEYQHLIRDANTIKYKSPWLATGMSMVVPGTGKIYTGHWKDALMSIISIGALSWQAYRGFNKNGINSAYGWVFGSLAFGFYSGNVYGSWKAAKRYNQQLDEAYQDRAYHLFLDSF